MAVSKVHGHARDAKIAGEDLSNSLFYAAAINADGEYVLASDTTAVVGAIYETAPAGRPATVAFDGIINFVAGGVIATGATVGVDANGAVVAVTSGQAIGIARKGAAAAGEVIEVYFKPVAAVAAS